MIMDLLHYCKNCIDLYEALKRRKCKYGTGNELSFLGIVSLLKEEPDKLSDEIVAINNFLKDKNGFGYWSISSKERLMFSVALVCSDYIDGTKRNTMEMTLANNISSILIAQQMAAMTAASGSAAAAASTSN